MNTDPINQLEALAKDVRVVEKPRLHLALRISSHLMHDKIWESKEVVDALEEHNSIKRIKSKIKIHRSYWTTEQYDMNGTKVSLHQHGYLQVSGVSLPTFRKIFKTHILKMDKFTHHKRGNALYSISLITTNLAQYCSYISKNLILDEIPDTYLKNASWYNFTTEEIQLVLNSWRKMKETKTTFSAKRKLFGKEVEMLQQRFENSIGIWILNREVIHNRGCDIVVNNLTLEFLKLYIKYGISWKKYQVESKMNLWWYTKYPLKLEHYVKNMY